MSLIRSAPPANIRLRRSDPDRARMRLNEVLADAAQGGKATPDHHRYRDDPRRFPRREARVAIPSVA